MFMLQCSETNAFTVVYKNGMCQRVFTLAMMPPNQSLKLTAEAEVVSRNAQENKLVVAARRQCWTDVRILR
jgi:hypothetical protein